MSCLLRDRREEGGGPNSDAVGRTARQRAEALNPGTRSSGVSSHRGPRGRDPRGLYALGLGGGSRTRKSSDEASNGALSCGGAFPRGPSQCRFVEHRRAVDRAALAAVCSNAPLDASDVMCGVHSRISALNFLLSRSPPRGYTRGRDRSVRRRQRARRACAAARVRARLRRHARTSRQTGPASQLRPSARACRRKHASGVSTSNTAHASRFWGS